MRLFNVFHSRRKLIRAIRFIESLTEAGGKYKYLDGKSVVADARKVLRDIR
jgi:hypothetical protein